MNALVRAKNEWELVNARRLENLFNKVGAASGFLAFLCWMVLRGFLRSLKTLFKVQRGPPLLLRENYINLQQVQKFF